jgi:hypothetical protein
MKKAACVACVTCELYFRHYLTSDTRTCYTCHQERGEQKGQYDVKGC